MEQTKKRIDLTSFHGLGLVLLCPSGVWYGTQAEGLVCSHPSAEGVYLPFPAKPGASELWALMQHFNGAWGTIDTETADIMDRILRRHGHANLKVNRSRLAESYEAWVYMQVEEPKNNDSVWSNLLSGFGKCEAIFDVAQ